MKQRHLRAATVATVAALLLLVGYVLYHAFPSTEAVRLRNSLLIDPADARAGQWTPETAPSTFLAEKRDVPAEMRSAALQVIGDSSGSDIDKAMALASHLLIKVEEKGPIQSLDVGQTYRAIREEGRGYCSDIVDAYTALALAAGLAVRPWAFSFDGFGGYGHIVVEVFDRPHSHWVMLDVFNNVMPVGAASGAPMSVHEFVAAFRAREADVRFARIGPGHVSYRYDDKLREYYRRGVDQWYLWNGNNVVSRLANHSIVSVAARVAEPLGELTAIALGDYPRIVPLATATNARQVQAMVALRYRLLCITAVCLVLGVVLIVELIALLRHPAPRRESRGQQPRDQPRAQPQ